MRKKIHYGNVGACWIVSVTFAKCPLRTGGGEPADISAVMAKVDELLDESIVADGFKQSKKKNIDL